LAQTPWQRWNSALAVAGVADLSFAAASCHHRRHLCNVWKPTLASQEGATETGHRVAFRQDFSTGEAIMDNPLPSQTILDSIGSGVYVTDVDRHILYWNKAAEGVTGWRIEDVAERSCDEILCHVDEDGRRLCRKEYCPLHRSIVTGLCGDVPLVLARTKDAGRVPLQIMVAPLRDAAGAIIGAIQVFHNTFLTFLDLERARLVQSESCKPICRKILVSALRPTTIHMASWVVITTPLDNSMPITTVFFSPT
jgi:PAS domain S-box-containing protein